MPRAAAPRQLQGSHGEAAWAGCSLDGVYWLMLHVHLRR